MTFPNRYCPKCPHYLNTDIRACYTGCPDPARLTNFGEPIWKIKADGFFHTGVILSDVVVFSHSSSGRKGGVTAFHLADGSTAWSYSTAHPVESALSASNGVGYFASTGFLGGDAEVFCLDSSGRVLWRKTLSSGARSYPYLDEARLILALDDGSLAGFDRHSGSPLDIPRLSLPRGKHWLLKLDAHRLAVVSERGQITVLNLHSLSPVWMEPFSTGEEITSPPCLLPMNPRAISTHKTRG